MAENFSGGNSPLPSNPQRIIEVKILNSLNNSQGGGTGTGTYSGSGSPQGSVTASPGASYWDTTGQSLWMKSTGTGNTGWTQVVA